MNIKMPEDNTQNLNNPVWQNMLKLLAYSLNSSGEDFQLDMKLWPQIKEELENHCVLALTSDCLMNFKLSEDEKLDLSKKVVDDIKTFHKIMETQNAVLGLFNANNVSAVILKGAAASQYYKKPELRKYGDIDILVLPEDYRKSFDLLLESGFKNKFDFDNPYQRHIGFTAPNGVEIELHRYFFNHQLGENNLEFDHWLYDGIKKNMRIELNGYQVQTLPILENGLVLLNHIDGHLCSGLGLRQIIDWMFYVDAELSDDFWREEFQCKARAMGMGTLAKTVTKMCQKYLGLTPEITWCTDADDELVDSLLLYILKKGNFGRKIEVNLHNTTDVIHSISNLGGVFQYLTTGGMIHMSNAGLKPNKAFAWLYQIGHIICKFSKRKHKTGIMAEMKQGIQEEEFLNKIRNKNEK